MSIHHIHLQQSIHTSLRIILLERSKSITTVDFQIVFMLNVYSLFINNHPFTRNISIYKVIHRSISKLDQFHHRKIFTITINIIIIPAISKTELVISPLPLNEFLPTSTITRFSLLISLKEVDWVKVFSPITIDLRISQSIIYNHHQSKITYFQFEFYNFGF